MRKLLCCILLTAFIGCNNSATITNLNGAFSMRTQSFKGKSVDTTSAGNRQLKIYIDSMMMYVLVNPVQNVSAFAVGKFSFDSGRLIENIMYNATENLISTTFSDTVNIAKNDTGYTQETSKIVSDKGEIKITETYTSIGTTATSAIDGIWKQVSSYALRGNDTITHNDVEYKAFYAGNFAYGDYYTDSLQQKNTGISHGTFSLDSNHHLTETITASTWPELNDRTFVLDIKTNGNDSFTQTTTNATGDTEISVYERVK